MFNNSNITGIFFLLIVMFCVLGCRSCSGGYSVSNGKVYYNDGRGGITPLGTDIEIPQAEAETFEIINNRYGRDKDQIYFENRAIAGCDLKTFEVIDTPYSKDKNNVYREHSVLTDKPRSFKILSSGDLGNKFSTDGTKVFLRDKEFFPDDVDPATFQQIGKSLYMRDKSRIYNSARIIDADPKSFEVINYYKHGNIYAKDRSSIFYNGIKVKEADVETHQTIDSKYHKDKDHVFKETKIVSDDPENFQVPESDY